MTVDLCLETLKNQNQTTMTTIDTMLKMVFDRWNGSIKNFDGILQSLTEEQLQKEIAPGKNRGIYILGHLIAVHDEMLLLLGLGDKLFPGLYGIFIKAADKTVAEIPSANDLRTYWSNQCELLKQKFEALKPTDWFEKHTAVFDEDFLKEPHRNKLNIIITRTTHLTYHTGQLVLLK